MKEKISALMDGELGRHEAGAALDALRDEGAPRAAWRRYNLIGDAMRAAPMLSAGFAARVAEKIAQEPTVLAPSRRQRPFALVPVWALSAAASLAAVTLVGWLAFAPQEEPQFAKAALQSAPASEIAQVAPPDAANDYLLAHQGYSPRNSLQGMAPYVRTVSTDVLGARR